MRIIGTAGGFDDADALLMPADANPSGDIFGGWVLSQMDIATESARDDAPTGVLRLSPSTR